VAVALGAAYHAYECWEPQAQYRRSVEQVAEAELGNAAVTRLAIQATELGLREEQAAKIERDVLGTTKEAIFEHQQAVEQYQKAVEQVRSDLTEVEQVQADLIEKEVENLTALAQQIGLNGYDVLTVEQRVLGEAKETILARQQNRERYRVAVRKAWGSERLDEASVQELVTLAQQLQLGRDDVTTIERKIMGKLKEGILAHQRDCVRYAEEVKEAWKDGQIDETKLRSLNLQAEQLHVSRDEAAEIERNEMRATKEELFEHHDEAVTLLERQSTPKVEQMMVEGKLWEVEEKLRKMDEEADRVISRWSFGALIGDLLPPPFDTMAIIGAIARMGTRLAKVYEVPIDKSTLKGIAGAIYGGIRGVAFAGIVGTELLKLIPGMSIWVGLLIQPPIVAAITYSTGKTFKEYFHTMIKKGQGLSPEEISRLAEAALREKLRPA
jgi:uncharacterized protein (DUF697 family)